MRRPIINIEDKNKELILRNRRAAQQSRDRKITYMKNIEEENRLLKETNKNLEKENEELEKQIKYMQNKVKILEWNSVVRNSFSNTITKLLDGGH